MYKKVISFILSVLMICSCTVFSYAHSTPVNVEYDDCSIDKDENGEDELWYKIDEYSPMIDIPVHLSDNVEEIVYCFSDTANGNSSETWISCVQTVAQGEGKTLSYFEANLIVEKIKEIFSKSMQKWNDVYCYGYDSGNKTAYRIVNVREAAINEDPNLIIYPRVVGTVASTDFSRDQEYCKWVYDLHHHSNYWTIEITVKEFYETLTSSAEYDLVTATVIQENAGAHEIGHVLGLSDLDIWHQDLCKCDACLDNDSDTVCKGHHEEALMGYGETASRVTHITYKDIAGVSITRGFHDDDDHLWMLRENMNSETNEIESYDVICALCNGVRYDVDLSDEDYLNVNNFMYKSCVHHDGNNEEMILVATDGERNFFKCRYCRYIEEVDIADVGDVPLYEALNYSTSIASFEEKYYRFNIFDTTIYNFKATNANNVTILLQDEHFNIIDDITDSILSETGYNATLSEGIYHLYVKNPTSSTVQSEFIISPPTHTHSYNTWVGISPTKHIKACDDCGELGVEEGVHAVKVGAGRFKPCIVCGYLVDTNFGIGEVAPFSITMVTSNGSYILPSGIIVLVDEDVEAYLNGTLVFYDKDKLPVTQ